MRRPPPARLLAAVLADAASLPSTSGSFVLPLRAAAAPTTVDRRWPRAADARHARSFAAAAAAPEFGRTYAERKLLG